MFYTPDPIASLVVVIGVFVYYALKSAGTSSKKEDMSVHDIYRDIGERSAENQHYQNWLKEHQEGVQLPTAEERHAEYMRKLAKTAADREEERRYELWLFNHCEYFKTPKERFEAWINR